MIGDGFFAGDEYLQSNALVLFLMTFLLLLALPFTFGLVSLLLIQVFNFATGMTTMERLGSASHRLRRFAFVDQIEEAASLEQ